MKIPQSKIDEIAASVDIIDVISRYMNLKKAGKNFMGKCPFHEERTPSFSVSQEKGVYHCFGCGKSGNVFNFIMDIDNVSFFESVKILAEKANIKLEFDDESYYEDKNQIELLYEINRKAAKYFYENLMSNEGSEVRGYLSKRGIKDETIKKFGFGFAYRSSDKLYNKFKNEFKNQDLISSGLIIGISQNEFKDRFRGRLMIPIISESGKVVGFGGRKLFDDNDEAKYINSPETRIYNKSKTLFGLNFAKSRIKEKGFALLVEGYMDLISLFQYGIENVVASSGTSLSSLQVKILSRYSNEIVIVFDADSAGQNAARRGIEIILENDLNISIVELPKGEDPDTYIRTNGKDKFERLVEGRKSVINYISDRYKEENKLATPEGKTEFVREIISLISKMKDAIKRNFYVKDISERFSIYESILRGELSNYIKLKSKYLTQKPDLQKSSVNLQQGAGKISNAESMLIRLLLESDKTAKEYLIDNLEIDFIINPHIAKITNYIFQNYNNQNKIKPSSLLNHFEDPLLKNIISKSAIDESTYAAIDKANGTDSLSLAKWVVSELKLQNINKEIFTLQNKMKTDERYSISSLEHMKKLIKEKESLKKAKEELFKNK